MKKIVMTSAAFLALSAAAFADGVPATCFGCHGATGDHNTMVPESKPNTLTKDEIKQALHGYKEGTLDKYKKGSTMTNFAKSLTDQQIEDIANAWGK